MTKQTVKVEIIANTWDRFVEQETLRRKEFARCAFLEWMRCHEAFTTPVWIDHCERFELPRIGLTHWKSTKDDLRMSFKLDVSREIGRATMLAIKHGFLGGASLGSITENQSLFEDKIGRYNFVMKASIFEVSLTSNPACKGTSTCLAGHSPATTKTLPVDARDRDCLVRFLNRIGYDPTIPKPVPVQTPQVIDWRKTALGQKSEARTSRILWQAMDSLGPAPSQRIVYVPVLG